MKLIPPEITVLDSTDRAAKRKHALAEGLDVPIRRAVAILQEDVVLKHRFSRHAPWPRVG